MGYFKFGGEDMTSKKLVYMFMFTVRNKKVQYVNKIVLYITAVNILEQLII